MDSASFRDFAAMASGSTEDKSFLPKVSCKASKSATITGGFSFSAAILSLESSFTTSLSFYPIQPTQGLLVQMRHSGQGRKDGRIAKIPPVKECRPQGHANFPLHSVVDISEVSVDDMFLTLCDTFWSLFTFSCFPTMENSSNGSPPNVVVAKTEKLQELGDIGVKGYILRKIFLS